MPFTFYVLKSIAILSMFYGVYYLFLRSETFFEVKRHFLISGIIASIIAPFIKIKKTLWVNEPKFTNEAIVTDFTEIIATKIVTPAESTPLDLWEIGVLIYISLALILFIKFLVGIYTLYRLLNTAEIEKKENYYFVKVAKNISPFSFFKFIVYNPKLHLKEELEIIIKHEKTHALQYHSIDILLASILAIFQWINPVAWLYKKAIKENLEYLADQKTISKITSKKAYQLTLVQTTSLLNPPSFTNQFYQSFIKKRIIMFNKNQSKKRNVLKTTFILPLLAIFLWSFNVVEEIKFIPENGYEQLAEAESFFISKTIEDSELEEIKASINERQKNYEVIFKDIERNSDGTLYSISINTKFGDLEDFNKNILFGGKNSKNFETLELISFDKELLIKNKNTQEDFFSITQQGIVIKTQNQSLKTIGDNPLYIINGKKYKKKELPKNTNIVTDSIEFIEAKKAKKVYGEDAKDGVIVTKGKSSFTSNVEVPQKKKEFSYLITKNTSEDEFEKIKNNLKDKHSIDFQYIVNRNELDEIISLFLSYLSNSGENYQYIIEDQNGIKQLYLNIKDGGIEILTKNAVTSIENKDFNNKIKLKNTQTKGAEKALFIINGREATNFKIENLNDIVSVNVIKDEAAKKLYGIKGENGVIEIITKTGFQFSPKEYERKQIIQEVIIKQSKKVITKNTTNDELEEIKEFLAAKNIDFKYRNVKRNKKSEITSIKITTENNKGTQTNIQTVSSKVPIEPIEIEF